MADDCVFLEGMTFYGYHGVHEEERRLGQRFSVDLAVTLDLRPATATDDVARTVSYSDLYRVTKEVVENTPKRLIETVAETIAAMVLDRFPPVAEVVVTMRKPEAPVKGSILDSVGVTVRRQRPTRGGRTNEGSDESGKA